MKTEILDSPLARLHLPSTGRFMATIGWPVYGDYRLAVYGRSVTPQVLSKKSKTTNCCLVSPEFPLPPLPSRAGRKAIHYRATRSCMT
jgi:hypothetical protein